MFVVVVVVVVFKTQTLRLFFIVAAHSPAEARRRAETAPAVDDNNNNNNTQQQQQQRSSTTKEFYNPWRSFDAATALADDIAVANAARRAAIDHYSALRTIVFGKTNVDCKISRRSSLSPLT
jgi:Sec-independent protein translocase protein TatA